MNSKNTYNAQWQIVDNAFAKGLPASAEKQIVAILSKAKSENNTEQIIKALCYYRLSLRDRDEKARLNDIELFVTELKNAKFPVKQLLHSMLGDLYWTYYQENRWNILDRTHVESTSIENESPSVETISDIETWSANQFYQATLYHFQQSLSETNASKSYKINGIDAILNKGVNTEKLRPTLYDFLVHRAIEYFRQEEYEITKPAYSFTIDDDAAFGPAISFSKSIFKTSDSGSRKYQALQLFQQLIAFHLHDEEPSAFIDADIARIQYVNDQSTSVEHNKLYVKALEDICNKNPNHEQTSMAMFYIAETFTQGTINKGPRGYVNSSINEENINYIEAKKRCDEIIHKFPNSEGAYRASLLLQQIETHSLMVNTEKVILPNQASLAMVNFKNINTLYCKIVKISFNEYREFNQNYDENYKKLLSKTSSTAWVIELPKKDDYKNHSTEIKIPSLPIGNYALFVSESNAFEKDNYTTLSMLCVSNLAYMKSIGSNGKESGLYVVDRTNGEPIQNANIRSFFNPYDYNTRKYTMKEGSSYSTNIDGYARFNQSSSENGYLFEIVKGDDHLFINDYIYSNDYVQPNQEIVRTFLFTDRSIYRPGQTIYFKGIVVQSHSNDSKKHALLKNRKTTISLLDVNQQMVKQEEFTTNEFGSFSGTFTAPEGLLNGMFHIQAEGGQQFIRIEEYKRPKFEVTYDTLKDSYKLNDMIHVKGLVKAYAGNNIDGAMVKYRIFRKARFPYYWCFYRWGQPISASLEIGHGFCTTKTDGSFDISFKAIPDESIAMQTSPVFDYEINADVTDLNGETRSGTTTISVSYQALMINLNIPQVNNLDDFHTIEVNTTNLAGTYVASEIMLTCKKLKAPSKTYRSRLWPKVEINSIPEALFRKEFPFDEYNNENDYLQWPEEKTIWSKSFHTNPEGRIELPRTTYDEAWYVIEAKTKDKYGEEVLEKKYIRLSSYIEPSALPNEHLLITRIKLKAEPGENAKWSVSTPFENTHLLYEVSDAHAKAQWFKFTGTRSFNYPIQESNRGGFYVNAMYIRNNRYYSTSQFVEVPWTNKDLSITLETFRDKMYPGSQQEWKLKITGSKKEKVSAELLTTMYDASLDAFAPHAFNKLDLYPQGSLTVSWEFISNFSVENGRPIFYRPFANINPFQKTYDNLNWWNLKNDYGNDMWSTRAGRGKFSPMLMADASEELQKAPSMSKALGAKNEREAETSDDTNAIGMKDETQGISTDEIQLRSNFSETAFFYPDLQTDLDGNIIFKFKAPEALTKWKLLSFAHTLDLKYGMQSSTVSTQKELMIIPNTPRFFREGDRMIYSAKITNLSNQDLSGTALLQLVDVQNEQSIDKFFSNNDNNATFAVKKGESTSVSWGIQIPKGIVNPIIVRTFAKANAEGGGSFSDGEQNIVPILSNAMLVTETMPLPVRTNTTKHFSFKKLLDSRSSSTLRHHNLTLEYTSNPAWYAVQALPYLTDYPYECAEQTFNRYYANLIATHIANSSPKIKEIFGSWESKDSNALLSNLEKNQSLKSALLQETPWVLDAKNQSEQKRNIATLFDLTRMSKELSHSLHDLELLQSPNGGFTWFKGMPDDRFITQYIVTGIGRLMHLQIKEIEEEKIMTIVAKAISYLDARIKEDYDELIKQKIDLKNYQPSYFQMQYLYARSFFLNNDVEGGAGKAFEYFKKQAALHWVENNRYMQGMLSLAMQRYGQRNVAMDIINSLRENAIHSEEMGMYWKEVSSSYWWYEAPIETQSILIEAFKEVAMSDDEVDELKIWLLKNKQTIHWKTTKATADACYALLLNGTYWLSSEPDVSIKMGDMRIESNNQDAEAGTGYFKTTIQNEMIKSELGDINVTVRSKEGDPGSKVNSTTWGAVYWQYFEDLDKITPSETPLKLKKQLFIERNTDKGPVLVPISNNDVLQVGDKVKVRIELRVDREMEYVHMKDMRGACFEPINVLSNFKYQGGLGYYESTKDAATNFFFYWLQKGTYVFEYPMFVTNKGNFSNGIATIQSMYAPEFSSHSEGIRVEVK